MRHCIQFNFKIENGKIRFRGQAMHIVAVLRHVVVMLSWKYNKQQHATCAVLRPLHYQLLRSYLTQRSRTQL